MLLRGANAHDFRHAGGEISPPPPLLLKNEHSLIIISVENVKENGMLQYSILWEGHLKRLLLDYSMGDCIKAIGELHFVVR